MPAGPYRSLPRIQVAALSKETSRVGQLSLGPAAKRELKGAFRQEVALLGFPAGFASLTLEKQRLMPRKNQSGHLEGYGGQMAYNRKHRARFAAEANHRSTWICLGTHSSPCLLYGSLLISAKSAQLKVHAPCSGLQPWNSQVRQTIVFQFLPQIPPFAVPVEKQREDQTYSSANARNWST